MPHPITVVDAFTAQPFSGNPAAVCILTAKAPESWMRDLAREMNLSETAFVRRDDDGWGLRWFTPTIEVDLCGHGTLASAHVLWESGQVPSSDEIRFFTRSGLLTARLVDGAIELNFPACKIRDAVPPEGLFSALGCDGECLGEHARKYVIELDSELTVRALDPNHEALRRVDARSICVTARSESESYDFVSRYFAPAAGIKEDPVTGSAHCMLGPHWSSRLGKRDLIGYQASARGGVVRVGMDGERVRLGGHAVTVLQGHVRGAEAGSTR